MSLLFETIRIKEGELQHITYHNSRFGDSQRALYQVADPIKLENAIRVPPEFSKGISRCKVVYGKQVEEVTFSIYIPRAIRSLKLVSCNTIDYRYKYTDRQLLNALLQQRNGCDEILIVKDGFITDTSFSNIVFRNGDNWVTPANPLLCGTMRAHLLNERIIKEEVIRVCDLEKFSAARLINAMLPLDSGQEIPVKRISPL